MATVRDPTNPRGTKRLNKDLILVSTHLFRLVIVIELLRRTGMPGAVMVRINTREYDNKILLNVSNNRRSTRLILYIIKF